MSAAAFACHQLRVRLAGREVLRGIGDLERILARVALRSARPRDLSTLRDGLLALPNLRSALSGCDSPLLAELLDLIGEHVESARHLAHAVLEQPPALLRDGADLAALAEVRRSLGVPLVMVLGHERCGAVSASCSAVDRLTACVRISMRTDGMRSPGANTPLRIAPR